MQSDHTHAAVRWGRVGIVVLAAISTYFLRPALAAAGLQPLTFVIPVLFAAYAFGSRHATFAAVLSLSSAHLLLWQQNPQLLFTRSHFAGVFNFSFIAGVIVLYTWRQEQVLRRLDRSLEGERAARADAEDANRLKDEFLATLSHELRTPTNVMLGYLNMLLSERAADPRRALEIAYRNAQQQARLIDDVLDASRIATGNFQLNAEEVMPLAIMREVAESVQPAIAAKELTLELSAPAADVVILADPQRLRQVFWNVLSNAVKFTPAGGRILVQMQSSGTHVELRVQDTGRGIAPDFLPFVFDMFRQGDASTTREASGVGLGLALVKRFVELQGGEVAAESPGEGKGATFICRFPVFSTPAQLPLTASQHVGSRVNLLAE